ncbi:MAG: alpha/beta hydrolase [Chlamydiales bacterium]|nr:alpha/beta hydrolase [Chlamydiales bacterium]
MFYFNFLQAQEGSLVCLHGFFRSYRCMIPMGNTLKREGLEVYLWDYQSRQETIESHAQNLVEILKEIAKNKPGEPIHFTTHSFGGIILRSAVNLPDCPQEAKIGKAVLLAPPNKGAHLAHKANGCPVVRWFFGKKAGMQLLTYNEHEMNSLGNFPDTMDVMVIAGDKGNRFLGLFVNGPNDGKVLVEETRLPTPHEHRVLNVSHHWIMTSREVIKLTKEFILNQ